MREHPGGIPLPRRRRPEATSLGLGEERLVGPGHRAEVHGILACVGDVGEMVEHVTPCPRADVAVAPQHRALAETLPAAVLQLDAGATTSAAVKRTSTSEAASASCPGCQVSTTRCGGSHCSTSPQTLVRPSTARSTRRPPSKASPPASAWNMPCVGSGHHAPICRVKTSNVSSSGRATCAERSTGGGTDAAAAVTARLTLGVGDEGREGVVPEAVDPRPQPGQAVEVDPVEPAGALRPHRHQARVAQHPQVLGDRGLADLGGVGQLTNALLTTAQQLEDGPPGGVAKGVQDTRFIGHHLS